MNQNFWLLLWHGKSKFFKIKKILHFIEFYLKFPEHFSYIFWNSFQNFLKIFLQNFPSWKMENFGGFCSSLHLIATLPFPTSKATACFSASQNSDYLQYASDLLKIKYGVRNWIKSTYLQKDRYFIQKNYALYNVIDYELRVVRIFYGFVPLNLIKSAKKLKI